MLNNYCFLSILTFFLVKSIVFSMLIINRLWWNHKSINLSNLKKRWSFQYNIDGSMISLLINNAICQHCTSCYFFIISRTKPIVNDPVIVKGTYDRTIFFYIFENRKTLSKIIPYETLNSINEFWILLTFGNIYFLYYRET